MIDRWVFLRVVATVDSRVACERGAIGDLFQRSPSAQFFAKVQSRDGHSPVIVSQSASYSTLDVWVYVLRELYELSVDILVKEGGLAVQEVDGSGLDIMSQRRSHGRNPTGT